MRNGNRATRRDPDQDGRLYVALLLIDLQPISLSRARLTIPELDDLLQRDYIAVHPAIDRQRGRARQSWPEHYMLTDAGRDFVERHEAEETTR